MLKRNELLRLPVVVVIMIALVILPKALTTAQARITSASEQVQQPENQFAFAAEVTPDVTPEVTAEPTPPTPPNCPNFPYTVPASNATALMIAIACANSNGTGTNDVINLTNSTYTLTAVNNTSSGGNGLPIVTSAAAAGTLTINGNGATIARSSAGSTPSFRLVYVANGGNLTLSNLTLTGGSTTDSGGAIFVFQNATLTLNNLTLTNNHANATGGAIENAGTLSVTNSTLSGNTAVGGGAIDNIGTLTLTTSTLHSNVATWEGGAIDNYNGTLYLINSTIYGNEANGTTAVDGGGALNSDGTSANVMIVNSTITGNTAAGQTTHGGLFIETGTLSINNSIVADNGGGDCVRTGGTVTVSHSLIRGGGCDVVNGSSGNLTTVDPKLDTLVTPAGGTAYYPLQTDSPAINAGDNALALDKNGVALTTDQRGVGFPRVNGSTVDMGAYEAPFVNTAPTISTIADITIAEDTPSGAISFTIADAFTSPEDLTVTGVSSDTSRVSNAGIVFSDSGADRTVTITPVLNRYGTATITITVSDGELTASESFTIQITAVNDPPTVSDIPDQQILVNTQTKELTFRVDDADGGSLRRWMITSSNPALLPNENIVPNTGSGIHGSMRLYPLADQVGTTTITITGWDLQLNTGSNSFQLVVVNELTDDLFSDGFESGDLSHWFSNANDGDLSVSANASLVGSFGLQATINDANEIYVTDETPGDEKRYRARFYFDPNSITMADYDNFVIFGGYSGSVALTQVQLQRFGNRYNLRVGTRLYSGSYQYTPYVTLTDAPHLIEVAWQAASANGASDGSVTLWLDQVQRAELTGVTNSSLGIQRALLGAVYGMDTGTSGTIYFDDFVSRRDTYIGPAMVAPTLVSPADNAQVTRETAPSLKWNAVTGATQYYVEFTNGMTVNVNSGWIAGTSWSTGSQPQGAYTWRVKARSAGGQESDWSASRTLIVRPGAPTNLQTTPVGATKVNLTWTASVDAPNGITSYRIYREGVQIGTSNRNTPSFTDNGAVACAANHYKVRAVNGTVSSPDSAIITVNTSCDTIFSDGFESNNVSAWSANANDGGDLSVTTDAHLTISTYGMQAVIDDNVPIHVTDNTPNAEPRYRARFYFDPNSLTMATNETLFLFFGYQLDSTVAFRLQLRRSAGGYQLRTGVLNDSGTTLYASFFNITDAPHLIELDWQAASGDGANDGSLTLWIDEAQQTPQSGIDNDTLRIDRVRLGAVTGIQAGTSGTMYFDAFASTRTTYIGAEVGGFAVIVEPEPTETPTPEITPEATAEPTDEPTAEVTPEATAEPTIEPTATPTVEPTLPPVEPTVEPTMLPFSVPVFQTMDDGAPLWTASAGWQLSADAAYSGLGWLVTASGNVETLTLQVPVNLAGAAAPTLSFQSKLVSGVLPEVRVSLDGATWQTVASVTPSLNWAQVTVDLSADAGQIIQLQFVWATPANASDSWQVDEVTVADGSILPPPAPTDPYIPTETPTATPIVPGNEPPIYIPTPAPREGGSMPDTPADLPLPPVG